MRNNTRQNYSRVHVYGDAPITSNTWTHVERDQDSRNPRRYRVILIRAAMILALIILTFASQYIKFSNFIIASAFITCTFCLCVVAIVIVITDIRNEDAEREQMFSNAAVPENGMNELLSSAQLVAQARNIASQRRVDIDQDFANKFV